MKFKLINNEVTDEREKALGNKVAAECYYIMIAGTLVCLVMAPSLTMVSSLLITYFIHC